MSKRSTAARVRPWRRRSGVVLVAVLYFLVVCGLTVIALLFTQRSMARGARSTTNSARLLAAAESAVYETLARWDGPARERQPIGTTTRSSDASTHVDVYITRVSFRVFSIIADAHSSSGIARRSELLVRLPFDFTQSRSALVSAVNVSVASGVRFLADTGACADSATAIILAPGANLTVDPSLPLADRPTARSDSTASDSATYLQLAGSWWSDMTRAADIVLPHGAHVLPSPVIASSECVPRADNWGEPVSTSSPCARYVPVVFAAGDLTIDGGVGQGVLLVDGHLVIAGPFAYSGQIVARYGIETRADNITISGVVYAWRGSADTSRTHATSNEVMLTHATTLRRSVCDSRHGVASWLEPRRVRERASAELF